ncbi:MAG: hypothetical protein PHI87_05730 [Candidatus Methanomethylophilus sp.]|nr:hypothetical protein [Methanomethylophilus sp.]
MFLLIIQIPDDKEENTIFTFEDDNEKSVNKLIELIKTMYPFNEEINIAICKIIKQTDNFNNTNLESYLQYNYEDHIDNLNHLIKKYYKYQANSNDIKDINKYAKNIHSIEDDIKYNRSVIKVIRSLARLNYISLAKEKNEDVIHYRLPGCVFK